MDSKIETAAYLHRIQARRMWPPGPDVPLNVEFLAILPIDGTDVARRLGMVDDEVYRDELAGPCIILGRLIAVRNLPTDLQQRYAPAKEYDDADIIRWTKLFRIAQRAKEAAAKEAEEAARLQRLAEGEKVANYNRAEAERRERERRANPEFRLRELEALLARSGQ